MAQQRQAWWYGTRQVLVWVPSAQHALFGPQARPKFRLPSTISLYYSNKNSNVSQGSGRPNTRAGVVRSAKSPVPSCPEAFAPQHWTVLSARSAQACDQPASICTAVVMPRTGVAVRPRPPGPPSPSCPALLSPQQETRPSRRRAQACDAPAATSTAFETPRTSTGVECSTSSGGPSPDLPSSRPMQTTPPSRSAAQPWSQPTTKLCVRRSPPTSSTRRVTVVLHG